MAICDSNSSFAVTRGWGRGKLLQEPGWGKTCSGESLQRLTFLGFRATGRLTDILSTYIRPDRELCATLRGKNSVQEMELFLYRMISENCLVHLLGTHEKRISWASIGNLLVLWCRYFFLFLIADNKKYSFFPGNVFVSFKWAEEAGRQPQWETVRHTA